MTNHVEIDRDEAPLANFYLEPQPWTKRAACKDVPTELFFEVSHEREALQICNTCPKRVRELCGEAAMVEEGAGPYGRYGVRGGMTPDQRAVVHRRGGLMGRDGMALVAAQRIGHNGDLWSRHLSTLTRKVYHYVVDRVEVGGRVRPEIIARELPANAAPLDRALAELTALEVLAHDDKGRHRLLDHVPSRLPRYLRASDRSGTTGGADNQE